MPMPRTASNSGRTDSVSAAPLNNLRAARTQALLSGEPSVVTMLVQAGGNGHDVPTAWPGHLDVVASGGRPLVSVLDEALAPVDREVFRRQIRYDAQASAQTPATPAAAAK